MTNDMEIPVRFLTKDRGVECRKVDATWSQEHYRFIPDKYLRLTLNRPLTFKSWCEEYPSEDIHKTENYRLEEVWYMEEFSHYYYVHESISSEHFNRIVSNGYLKCLERQSTQ